MVNPGHRSRGCLTCRQMKVKCDEQRPQCGRCVRTRRECPGYVRLEQPKFRSMNSSAEAKVQSRVREALAKAAGASPAPSTKSDSKSANSPSDSDSDPARELAAERKTPAHLPTRARRKTPSTTSLRNPAGTARASSNPPPSQISSQPPDVTSHASAQAMNAANQETAIVPAQALRFSRMSNDWSAQALALFFRDFTEQPDHLGSTFGTYGYLPYLYGNGQQRHLTEAVNAAALANLANVSGVDAFNKMARRHYGAALVELGSAINIPESAIADETLATTSALTMYELITGEQPLNELFNSHFRGQSAILRMRGPQLELTPWSKSLVGSTNRMLIWSDLAEGQKPSLSLPDWPIELYASELAETSARLGSRASFVCGRIREVMEVPETERKPAWLGELTEVVTNARVLVGELEQYMLTLPAPWKPWSLPVRYVSPPPIREDTPWQKLGLGNTLQVPRAAAAGVGESSSSSASMRAYEMASANLGPHNLTLPESFPQGIGIGADPTSPLDAKESFGPMRPPRTEGDGSATYPSRIDVYPSITVAYLLVSISCVHIHVLRSMVDLAVLREGGAGPEECFTGFPSPNMLYRALCGKVEDVCAAIPYVLNDVDAVGTMATDHWHKLRHTGAATVLWGLHKVCSIPGLEPGLRQWILGVYDRVGCLGGMRKALVLADQYRLKWANLR